MIETQCKGGVGADNMSSLTPQSQIGAAQARSDAEFENMRRSRVMKDLEGHSRDWAWWHFDIWWAAKLLAKAQGIGKG